jgi:hypothetical protein
MSYNNYQEQNFDYQADGSRREDKEKTPRQRSAKYSRANRPVVMHNGMHRRRNKRFSW